VIQGQDLKDVVDLGKTGTTIILDEFYSWYMYWDDKEKIGKSISGAEYVDDVNADSVILIDGMTKGPRLPVGVCAGSSAPSRSSRPSASRARSSTAVPTTRTSAWNGVWLR
jgi:aspartate/methionine/tyrosine aminotransferase